MKNRWYPARHFEKILLRNQNIFDRYVLYMYGNENYENKFYLDISAALHLD